MLIKCIGIGISLVMVRCSGITCDGDIAISSSIIGCICIKIWATVSLSGDWIACDELVLTVQHLICL